MKLFNGKAYLECAKSDDKVQIIVDKTQYDKGAIATIQSYCQVEQIADDLTISYTLPQGAIPFHQVANQARTKLEKLRLANKLSQLIGLTNDYQIPYLHPENMYMVGGQLVVIHSGLRGILTPDHQEAALFLDNLKSLILSLFMPKLPYEKILAALSAFDEKFAKRVVEADNIEDLFAFLRQEMARTEAKLKATKRLVSKHTYQIYRVVGVLTIMIALISGISWYRASTSDKQKKDIIEAQTSFIINNYAKAQTDLEKYEPKALNKSAKYILAVSSINLADLTAAQKQVVLNQVSIKSDDNTLNYWLYMGRGEFEKALNLAQNLGDEQLTLLAYTDLYQATKLNDKMAGAKKQKRLADYSKQIDELTKKLGK